MTIFSSTGIIFCDIKAKITFLLGVWTFFSKFAACLGRLCLNMSEIYKN